MKKVIYKTISLLFVLLVLGNLNESTAQDIVNLKITSPGNVDWDIDAVKTANDHGVQIFENLSGEIARAFDGVTEPTDNDTWTEFGAYCCDSIVNPSELAGKIAYISRGACSFSDKIWNAEKAGAIGVIVANRAPIGLDAGTHTAGLVNMGGTAPASDSITIPAIFISFEDRLELEQRMDEGPVMATMEVAAMYDPCGPRAYSTPLDQVRPLDMQVVSYTREGDTLFNVEFLLSIVDPSGQTTVFTELIDTLLPGKDLITGTVHDPIIEFEDEYTPSEVGTYTMTYSAATEDGGYPIDATVVSKTFEVTDYTFALDNGAVMDENGIDINYDIYNLTLGINNVGAYFVMGPNGGTATYASFALANPGVLDIGNGFEFEVKIYNADVDGDGLHDAELVEVVASTTYALTGAEVPNVPFDVDLGGPVTLAPDGLYCLMIESGGFLFSDQLPLYSAAGGEVYPRKASALVFGPVFQSSGYEYWNSGSDTYPHGGRHPVIRLHMEGYTPIVGLDLLPEDQVNIFPTLSKDVVNVQFDLNQTTDEVLLLVTSANGRNMYAQKYNNVLNETVSLGVDKYPAGTYFLTLQTNRGVRTKKFVVVK